ncbi:MAG TPA: acetamidase/formamidase family protein [Xanthobacteraceae bacterium]|jgi:acetamidase/formamidase
MHHLKANWDTVHFGFWDAALRPVLEIEDGDEIIVNTVSASPDDDVPSDWLPPEITDIYARAPRGTGPHILTGPIAVRGSQPGNVLQVDIRDIKLAQRYGWNLVMPLKGMFGEESPMWKNTIIPIDLSTGIATLPPGIKLQSRPFFGQLGVAPPREWGRLDSRPPQKFGGNLDNKELVPGTRLFLPISVEGALFSAGDGHAAQGDGEVNQTAIETGLQGRFRLSVRRDLAIDLPFAVTTDSIITMGFDESLNDAARVAMRSLIRLLEKHYGLGFHDAYRLCSLAADLRVTQFVNGNRGIHAVLRTGLLGDVARRPAFFDGIEAVKYLP